MDIEVGGDAQVAVVAVSGRIDAYTAPDVEERLRQVLAEGATRHLVVDLEGTDYVSSAGLRVLITLAKRAMQNGFSLRLCALQEPVREVFDIAGFTRLFEIRDSQEAAVAELASG